MYPASPIQDIHSFPSRSVMSRILMGSDRWAEQSLTVAYIELRNPEYYG